jgi:hypothetical protein
VALDAAGLEDRPDVGLEVDGTRVDAGSVGGRATEHEENGERPSHGPSVSGGVAASAR